MNMKTDFLLPVMLLFATDSYAFDWLFEPDFNFKERYDDNVTMQINDPTIVKSMISTISPGVLLGYIADDNELKARFKWNELIYHDASDLDFSEKILDVSHQYQSDWFRIDLVGAYYEQSSLNTQLEEAGSGVLLSRLIPQTTMSISPSLLVNLTEKNALQFSYSYLDVSFDRPENLRNLSYSDYTNQQYSATAIHNYSERLSFNLSGSYSKYESTNTIKNNDQFRTLRLNPFGLVDVDQQVTQGFDQSSTTFTYQAGLQYAFDELTQLSLSAGMRDTTTETRQSTAVTFNPEVNNFGIIDSFLNASAESNQSSSSSGHVFSASLKRKGEWGDFSLNAGQQLNPASSGQQQQTTSFSVQGRYNLSERWSTGIYASYLTSEATSTVDNSGNSFNRNYATISPNIQWSWTPEINLQLAYTYREQEYTDRQQTAIANSVQLQFSYQPQINRQVK